MPDKLKVFKDIRGSLLPIELKNIPLQTKRVFCVYNVHKGVERGGHAHYKTSQYLLCVKGIVYVHLDSGGLDSHQDFVLHEGEGVLVPPMVWDSQTFVTDDAVLMVFADSEYDADDYIRDFALFKSLAKSTIEKH